jgi:hypothetical protein
MRIGIGAWPGGPFGALVAVDRDGEGVCVTACAEPPLELA